MSPNGMFIDDILFILGNPTRRAILELLSHKPYYAFELAKALGISQRAVVKHLEILHEKGFITERTVPSPLGPQRTYFEINRSIAISMWFGPHEFRIRMVDFPDLDEEYDDESKHIDEELNKFIKVQIGRIKELDDKLKKIEKERILILRERQRILGSLDEALFEAGFDETTKKIFFLILSSDKPLSVDEIAEKLRLSSKVVQNAIEQLQKNELIRSVIKRVKNISSYDTSF